MKLKAKYFAFIGILIFIWLLFKVDLSQLGHVFKSLNYYWLIPAFLFFILNLVGNFIRWHYIVNAVGIKISLKKAISISFQTLFAEHTPGKVGEPILRAAYLKKATKNSFSNSLFTTFFHRFIDLWSTVIQAIVVVLILFFIFNMNLFLLLPSIIVFSVVILVLFFLVYNKKATIIIFKPLFKIFVPKRFKEKLKKDLVEFYGNFKKINKKIIIISFIYDLVIVVLTAISLYFISLAIGQNIPFIHLIMVVPILTIAVGLPISIAGIGTREITFVSYFSMIGFAQEIGLAFGLIFFLFRILSLIPGLILSFFEHQ